MQDIFILFSQLLFTVWAKIQFTFRFRTTVVFSLVPRPLPQKAEKGSGVLSDISCHIGWGRMA